MERPNRGNQIDWVGFLFSNILSYKAFPDVTQLLPFSCFLYLSNLGLIYLFIALLLSVISYRLPTHCYHQLYSVCCVQWLPLRVTLTHQAISSLDCTWLRVDDHSCSEVRCNLAVLEDYQCSKLHNWTNEIHTRTVSTPIPSGGLTGGVKYSTVPYGPPAHPRLSRESRAEEASKCSEEINGDVLSPKGLTDK